MNKWTKGAIVGAFGSLIMFIIMAIGIWVTGVAPFNIPPSAAFLEKFGLNIGPLPLLTHFAYGMFFSVVFVFLFQSKMNIGRGIILSLGLWLIMMLVYSPLIGWGAFGIGESPTLEASNSLYLEPGPKYALMTLVLHLIYGLVIGWLNPLWIKEEKLKEESPLEEKAEELVGSV